MKEHPIIFSGPMVRAILEGRKTQTRRVAKYHTDVRYCQYGTTGDRLWVRENWNAQNQSGQWWHEVKRDERPLHNWAWTNPVFPAYESTPPRWLPSIHMPRAASRITLEVTGVRVERVQDISEDDARAEGVAPSIVGGDMGGIEYRAGYQSLWDSINSKRGFGWDANPWVWVVEFRRVEAWPAMRDFSVTPPRRPKVDRETGEVEE